MWGQGEQAGTCRQFTSQQTAWNSGPFSRQVQSIGCCHLFLVEQEHCLCWRKNDSLVHNQFLCFLLWLFGKASSMQLQKCSIWFSFITFWMPHGYVLSPIEEMPSVLHLKILAKWIQWHYWIIPDCWLLVCSISLSDPFVLNVFMVCWMILMQ